MIQFTLSSQDNDDNLEQPMNLNSKADPLSTFQHGVVMIAELQNAVRPVIRIASEVTHGIGRLSLTGSILVIAILTLFIAPAPANGQTTPEAPSLCIEETGDCDSPGSPPVPVSAASKKWNPGHYLKPQGNHAQSDTKKYLSSISSQLAKVDDSPEIRGAIVAYAWGVLEPNLGNYDWAPVREHLDYLSARGKKLIVSINVKCFGTNCTNLAPSDLTSEVFVTERASPTSIIKIWEARNMDLYIALWQAFAAEFDGNPALEMVLGAESTPSLQGGSPANYTKGAYATELKRMYSAQAAAFGTTNVIANVNFLGGEVSGLIEYAYQVGAGRGLPDVFDSNGSFVFRGECAGNDCAVRDYRGLVPHIGVVSTPTLSGKHGAATGSPAGVLAYGAANKFTHYVWVSNESGEDSWSSIIDAIENTNPNAHTACPTAYTKGCK